MLEMNNVAGGYVAGEYIVKNIHFHVKKGEFFGILGPNGSGKTTLLKMMSGLLPVQTGDIFIKGTSISSYSPKELAKYVAVLPQMTPEGFSYTVKEAVSLGRYAHQKGLFRHWTEEDEMIVQQVMKQTGVQSFQNELLHERSGGEKQRVFLAQALAQEPEILLLDEPTNHLDLSYQKELLDVLKKWTKKRHLTIISIFHDLNLASLYCDRLLLLHKGKVEVVSGPGEVLKEERVQTVYDTSIVNQPHPKIPKPLMTVMPATHFDEQEMVQPVIDHRLLSVSKEMNVLQSPLPLKTVSSAVTGAGVGWYKYFVNRHVDKNYDVLDHRREMQQYLVEKGFDLVDTVSMMTAVKLEHTVKHLYEGEGFSVFIVVTAGVSNAVDVSLSEQHQYEEKRGTINLWVFVNGELSDEAFIQSMMTATEAKVKVLEDLAVKDQVTGTIATGTSTDSILIAATQHGRKLQYAGTITSLGKLIGKGVYECTKEAILMQKGKHLN